MYICGICKKKIKSNNYYYLDEEWRINKIKIICHKCNAKIDDIYMKFQKNFIILKELRNYIIKDKIKSMIK